MRIAIAGDHHGVAYKKDLIRALTSDGHEVLDLAPSSTDPVDYPDYARAVGLAVRNGRAELGVLICGSGAGVSIAANKIRGVRAALGHDLFTARQARQDDDANVLCLGARVVSLELAIQLTRAFVGARFSGAPRHARRLAKVLALEAALGDDAVAEATPEWPTAPAVTVALERLERASVGARIWKRDASLWSDAEAVRPSIANRLGWLETPATMPTEVGDLDAFAASVRQEGFADVVLLGMGGSSLAAEVLASTFPPPPGAPALTVLDTTDPGAIRNALGRLKPARTLFLVSSKSGTTAEMLALYRFFRAELEKCVDRPGAHFVAITDAGTPLARLATEGRFRRIFLNAPDIGGRFSALSYFGLVPGALVGIDLTRLLDRARAMAAACGATVPAADNPGLRLAAVLGGSASAGRDKVTLVLSESIRSFGGWLEQLLTESTGKQGRGLVVVHDEAPGPPAVYGADRVFVALTLGADAAIERALTPLRAAGHPVARIPLADRFDLGGEFFRWELATAAAGALLEVNPFDEPNVAQAKEATQTALATFKERGRLPEWPADAADDVVRVLGQARAGDYVALLAYLTPEAATTAALQRLRTLLRDRTRLATTVGYGPRYLHSTGQLHKGGPPTPILLLLSAEDREDLPIPGERYGFGTLKMAQALGDLATLRAAHRRALWLPIQGPVVDAIDRLTAALDRNLR
ncbi:MAG TPA: RpiB/LacA/LacB family sugar-phosphate isomerase [Methylomirabilota bacterium]|jgi:RpiB/LacA/LacB family sugar-phosphate isomerase|nr:RpiB/LacA/LacB family sugar-phosphate isomerase [Methylomirabilota bacterium]